ARRTAMLVDPYMDHRLLMDFGTMFAEGVALRLLTDRASVKPSLAPAAAKWQAQYGSKRPLEVRLTLPRTLHDRLIVIDDEDVWAVSQSFKDLAAKSPATILEVQAEAASL